jgi:HD domain
MVSAVDGSLKEEDFMDRREFILGIGTFAIGEGDWMEQGTKISPGMIQAATGSASHTETTASTVAGIRLIDSQIARAATDLARSVSPAHLFNHAVRTFLFAALIGRARGQKFDEEVLYLACILHDLGLTERFEGDLPFEIQGAQAAQRFLGEHGYDTTKSAIVWDGIAMHPSAIGQFKQPSIALVGDGAAADVLGPDFSEVRKSQMYEVVTAYPRLGFKNCFVKTCADVVRRHPKGAARSFMRDIGERYVADYHPRNICDLIAQAPFEE